MAMRKRLIIVLSVLFLFISPSISTAAEKVYWDGMELKKGQSGRLTVTKPINLWKRTESGLEFIRVLKPGERYRVYRYDSLYGGQYGLGAGLYVTNMKEYIRYETPSRDKRMLVNYEKQYFVEKLIHTPTENYDQAEVNKITKRNRAASSASTIPIMELSSEPSFNKWSDYGYRVFFLFKR